MHLHWGISMLRSWEAQHKIPAVFFLDKNQITEICVILDSRGYRYLIYIFSPKSIFGLWKILALRQFGISRQTQEQLDFSCSIFFIKRSLDAARNQITKWIMERNALELSYAEGVIEAQKLCQEI